MTAVRTCLAVYATRSAIRNRRSRRASDMSRAAGRRDLRHALRLVVFLIRIDAIEIVLLAEDVFRREQPRFDRVIGVVVPERAVAPDDLQVLERVDEALHDIE